MFPFIKCTCINDFLSVASFPGLSCFLKAQVAFTVKYRIKDTRDSLVLVLQAEVGLDCETSSVRGRNLFVSTSVQRGAILYLGSQRAVRTNR